MDLEDWQTPRFYPFIDDEVRVSHEQPSLEIMGQLPNLDDFSLCTFKGSGFPNAAGEILRGRYNRRLELLFMDDFHASVVRSLLEAPEGLGFNQDDHSPSEVSNKADGCVLFTTDGGRV